MNSFMRKLNGNYDEEEVKPRKSGNNASNVQTSAQNAQKKGGGKLQQQPSSQSIQTLQAHSQGNRMRDQKQSDKRKPIQQQ
jgi:hypothetical protein